MNQGGDKETLVLGGGSQGPSAHRRSHSIRRSRDVTEAGDVDSLFFWESLYQSHHHTPPQRGHGLPGSNTHIGAKGGTRFTW